MNTVLLPGCGCCAGGVTALMLCKEPAVLEVLLAAGADVKLINSTSNSCLHVAVRHKRSAVILCLLIKAGADLHAVNSEGKTAAQLAHEYGYTLIEQLLNRAAQQGHYSSSSSSSWSIGSTTVTVSP
jgi:ankyrin repeat protein